MGTFASDATLAEALLRRDPEALAQIYRQHAGTMLGYVRAWSASPAGAEDVVQEIFLQLWQHPGKFDPRRGSLRTFLITQSRRRAVDAYRAESAKIRRQGRYANQAAPAAAVDDQVISLIEGGWVRATLTDLHPGEEAAIRLAFFGGHSYREVAALLGEPEGTVKSRIRSGLRRLSAGSRHQTGRPVGVA